MEYVPARPLLKWPFFAGRRGPPAVSSSRNRVIFAGMGGAVVEAGRPGPAIVTGVGVRGQMAAHSVTGRPDDGFRLRANGRYIKGKFLSLSLGVPNQGIARLVHLGSIVSNGDFSSM
jgi:hypothetical protein